MRTTSSHRQEGQADPVDVEPAIGVTTDLGVAPAEPPASVPASASSCAVHRDAIELGLSRDRSVMAIRQDLVDTRGFQGGYQSVKRFVRKLVGGRSQEACAVILTAPGEGAGRLRHRPHGSPSAQRQVPPQAPVRATLGYSRKSVLLLVSNPVRRLGPSCMKRPSAAWVAAPAWWFDDLGESVLTDCYCAPTGWIGKRVSLQWDAPRCGY
jgi:hypothetical protein